jgi:hypothetical protein
MFQIRNHYIMYNFQFYEMFKHISDFIIYTLKFITHTFNKFLRSLLLKEMPEDNAN